MEVRIATPDDLDGIMRVEEEAFGGVGDDAMASRETMAHRIALLNSGDQGWFWVAVHEGVIVGTNVVQPTNLTPAACTSWDAATDNGTLKRTFDPEGANLYGVSIAIGEKAPAGTASMMLFHALLARLVTGKVLYMFCARIPGFREANERDGVRAEDYWQLEEDGRPVDPLLRRFSELFGEGPERLLRDAFPPDEDSGGHGVLFATKDPVVGLHNIVNCIHRVALDG